MAERLKAAVLKTANSKGFVSSNLTVSVLALFLSGCVSIAANKRDVHEAYIQGLQKARTIAHHDRCDETVKTINKKIASEGKKQ